MNTPRFTVLLPVNRPPELLPFAIESVLAQEGVELELFIICDGAPPATAECAQAYAKRDPRVSAFVFDKGERHGEIHRHTALLAARYPLVAQIGDDDLWFPDYLATLGRLLDRVDFGNLLQASLSTAGAIHVPTGDLADPAIRCKMCHEAWNFFGPSAAGYRLSAYRRLPIGWSPAPPDVWTDLHMWRKFLSRDDLAFGTTFAVKGIKLGANERVGMPLADRASELAAVADHFRNPSEREDFAARAFKSIWRRLDVSLTAASQALERSQADADELRLRCEGGVRDLTAASQALERSQADAHELRLRCEGGVRDLTAASQALQRSQAETHELRQRCESEAQKLRQRFEADLRNLTVRIGELNSELSGVYASAQSIAEERDTTFAAYHQVLSSKSWSVTKPLRWGKQKLLQVAGKGVGGAA